MSSAIIVRESIIGSYDLSIHTILRGADYLYVWKNASFTRTGSNKENTKVVEQESWWNFGNNFLAPNEIDHPQLFLLGLYSVDADKNLSTVHITNVKVISSLPYNQYWSYSGIDLQIRQNEKLLDLQKLRSWENGLLNIFLLKYINLLKIILYFSHSLM